MRYSVLLRTLSTTSRSHFYSRCLDVSHKQNCIVMCMSCFLHLFKDLALSNYSKEFHPYDEQHGCILCMFPLPLYENGYSIIVPSSEAWKVTCICALLQMIHSLIFFTLHNLPFLVCKPTKKISDGEKLKSPFINEKTTFQLFLKH